MSKPILTPDQVTQLNSPLRTTDDLIRFANEQINTIINAITRSGHQIQSISFERFDNGRYGWSVTTTDDEPDRIERP